MLTGKQTAGASMAKTLREMQQDMIRSYRAEIAKLHQHLERFSGGMRIGERKFGGPWVDITDREIASLKEEIASYERTIARVEKEWADA
jgi:predicted RNase H-like nuclease (RuvC/YqgF family)